MTIDYSMNIDSIKKYLDEEVLKINNNLKSITNYGDFLKLLLNNIDEFDKTTVDIEMEDFLSKHQ